MKPGLPSALKIFAGLSISLLPLLISHATLAQPLVGDKPQQPPAALFAPGKLPPSATYVQSTIHEFDECITRSNYPTETTVTLDNALSQCRNEQAKLKQALSSTTYEKIMGQIANRSKPVAQTKTP